MTEPSIYAPDAAAAYDAIASALAPGEAMAAWVSQHVPLHGARVADLGAGTGVSSLALAAGGAKVVAVDASQESLDLLKSRRADQDVETVLADFRSFELGEAFDAIVMSRNTFFAACTVDDKLALLAQGRQHLAPGGRIFLDCTDPMEFLRHGGDATTVTYPLGTSRAVTITQTADRATQSILSIYMLLGASEYFAFHEQAVWATASEIALMARMAGLEVDGVSGSYDGAPYVSDSRSMLVILKAAE